MQRHSADEWPVAPRVIEDVFTAADAVVFGSLLMSLLRHVNRVKSASLAQLVNAIAPIMTEPGGPAWRQTTFFPFALTSRIARGNSLRVVINSERYDTAAHGAVDVIDAAATHDPATGSAAVFLVNRSQDQPATVNINARALGAFNATASGIHHPDHTTVNSLETPDRIKLVTNHSVSVADGMITLTLPPISWTAIELSKDVQAPA